MQLSHYLLIYCSPPPDHLGRPSLDAPHHVSVCVGSPKLRVVLQQHSHKSRSKGEDSIPHPAGSSCSYSPRCCWPPLWRGLAAGSRSSSLYTETRCYFLQSWRISLAGQPLASMDVWGCSPECRNLRCSMLNFMRFLPAWLGSSE